MDARGHKLRRPSVAEVSQHPCTRKASGEVGAVRIRRTVPHPTGCQLVQGAADRLPHTTHTCTGAGAVDNRLHARKRSALDAFVSDPENGHTLLSLARLPLTCPGP